MLFFVVICGVLALGSCQSIDVGKCPPDVEVQKDFELSKLVGNWDEITRIPMSIQKGWRCTKATFMPKGNNTVDTLNQGIYPDGSIQLITGDAKCGGAKCEGHWNIRISGRMMSIPAPYWILETDYKNYHLAYSCTEIPDEQGGVLHAQMLWIMSRTNTLDAAIIQRLQQKAAEMGLKAGEMKMNDRSAC